MSFEFVDVKCSGHITTVTLNRPAVMNALHKPAHFELHEVFNAFAADPAQWVAIVTGAGEPERVDGVKISANFFDLLGVKPSLGRSFRPEEDQVWAAPVALISDGLWSRKFGSSPDALGKSITVDGTSYRIVGVVPEKSPIYTTAEVFTPLGQFNEEPFRDRRASLGTVGIGRMKPGVTLAQARADMDSVARNLAAAAREVPWGSTSWGESSESSASL